MQCTESSQRTSLVLVATRRMTWPSNSSSSRMGLSCGAPGCCVKRIIEKHWPYRSAFCCLQFVGLVFTPSTRSTHRVVRLVSVGGTIGTRIGTYYTPEGPAQDSSHPLTHAIDILQVSDFLWSLLTNIAATAIISHKTWWVPRRSITPVAHSVSIVHVLTSRRHRMVISEGLRKARNGSTRAEKILVILIESGVLYCLSGVRLGSSSLAVRCAYAPLGDSSCLNLDRDPWRNPWRRLHPNQHPACSMYPLKERLRA